MINKKLKIAISIFCLILILILIFQKLTNKNVNESLLDNDTINLETSYDSETGLYYIQDEATGEIISASTNEDDLDFYIENPDYNPNPLSSRSTDLSSFVSYDYDEEEELY
jgi:hypothetical protein